jgi:lipopolysaccharide export LptBFGC system permease protein LptF
LAAPVFVIGALLSLLSLWLNLNVVPTSKATVRHLVTEQAAKDPRSLLKPGVVQGDLKGNGNEIQKMLIEGESGEWVDGFHLYVLPKPGGENDTPTYVHASRAALSVREEEGGRQLRVKLENAYFENRQSNGETNLVFAARAEPLVFPLKNTRDRRRANSMSHKEIAQEIAENPDLDPDKKLKMQIEVTKRYSFSMACLAFAFIAVPLGMQTRRRDTSRGLIISLLIGTAYFLLTMLADQPDTLLGATAMLWAPNIACVLLGLFLFRRARYK